MNRRGHPSIANYVTNWRRSDLTLGQKLRMQARNSWLRLKRRANCCGHDGEPGC